MSAVVLNRTIHVTDWGGSVVKLRYNLRVCLGCPDEIEIVSATYRDGSLVDHDHELQEIWLAKIDSVETQDEIEAKAYSEDLQFEEARTPGRG